jgi:hypothetical protein
MDSNDYFFPVWGGELNNLGEFVPKSIYGTAFYINNSKFITCGHTITNARQHQTIALSFKAGESNIANFVVATDTEVFDINDSGIIVCEIKRARSLKWQSQSLDMLTDIFSCGYPYGWDPASFQLMTRSFKGHIVRAGTYAKFNSRPACYELSYMCPRGLSGAPLMTNGREIRIVGVVIGNDMTDMIVSSFKETEFDGAKIATYEKSETMHLGIAMQVGTFMNINSRILNGTIRNYLAVERLIV